MPYTPSPQLSASIELRVRILRVIGWTLGSLTVCGTLFRAWIAPLQPQVAALGLALSLVLFAMPLFGSVRHWNERLGRALTLTFMLLVLSTGYLAGGVQAPVIVLLTVVPLVGVVLVGRRFGALMAVFTIAMLLGMIQLHHLDAVPRTLLSADALLVMRVFMLGVALVVVAATVSIYDKHGQELMTRLQREALTDPLTGLHNRRYLEIAFPQMERLAAARRAELWLALIDIDHFKKINDTHGHEVGDLCLQQVAMALRQVALGLHDCTVVRLSGDEFLVLAVGQRGQLRALMDRAQASLMALHGSRKVSISVGLAGLPVAAPRPELLRTLLTRADGALYRSKAGGRGLITTLDSRLDDEQVPLGRRSREAVTHLIKPQLA